MLRKVFILTCGGFCDESIETKFIKQTLQLSAYIGKALRREAMAQMQDFIKNHVDIRDKPWQCLTPDPRGTRRNRAKHFLRICLFSVKKLNWKCIFSFVRCSLNISFPTHRCQEEFQLRSSQMYMRSRVLEAEHGVCQHCGLHAHQLFVKVRDAPPSQRKEMLENTWLAQLSLKEVGQHWNLLFALPRESLANLCSVASIVCWLTLLDLAVTHGPTTRIPSVSRYDVTPKCRTSFSVLCEYIVISLC